MRDQEAAGQKTSKKAVTFQEVLRAWEMIAEMGWSGIQIVIRSNDSRPDLTVPVKN
jgi:hypothetical protein